jgi:hypothetical protein
MTPIEPASQRVRRNGHTTATNQRRVVLASVAIFAILLGLVSSSSQSAKAADSVVRTPLRPYGLIALEQYPHCDPSSSASCPASDAPLANAAQNPAISGLMLRMTWEDMEPSDGTFNWPITDAVFKLAEQSTSISQPRPGLTAHKFVVLSFVPGFETPSWALRDPAGKLPSAATGSFCIPYGVGAGTTATLPLPWDPTYLNNWSNFLQQIASHYESKPEFLMITADGPTSISEEMSLPGAAGPASPCDESADIASWKDLGYTSERYAAAWSTAFQDFHANFPNQVTSFAYYRGLPIPGAAQRTKMPADVTSEGELSLGHDFALEANGLTYQSPDDPAYQFVSSNSGSAITGFEMATAATTNAANMTQEGGPGATTASQALQNALIAGVDANVDFLEIYHEDADTAATDSGVMSVLQTVAGELPLPQYSPAYVGPPLPRPTCHGSSCT